MIGFILNLKRKNMTTFKEAMKRYKYMYTNLLGEHSFKPLDKKLPTYVYSIELTEEEAYTAFKNAWAIDEASRQVIHQQIAIIDETLKSWEEKYSNNSVCKDDFIKQYATLLEQKETLCAPLPNADSSHDVARRKALAIDFRRDAPTPEAQIEKLRHQQEAEIERFNKKNERLAKQTRLILQFLSNEIEESVFRPAFTASLKKTMLLQDNTLIAQQVDQQIETIQAMSPEEREHYALSIRAGLLLQFVVQGNGPLAENTPTFSL